WWGHAVSRPVSGGPGAIVFASRTGTFSSMVSGLAVFVSLLAGGAISGTVHVPRAAVRPVANFAFLGPPLSLMEDIASATLSVTAALIPILVPFVLVLIALGAMLLWQRRRATRPSVTSAR